MHVVILFTLTEKSLEADPVMIILEVQCEKGY